MMKTRFAALPVALGAILGSAISASAQTTPSTPPITTLSVERVLTLSSLLSTLTPNLPTNIQAAIASGAQEVRSRLIYNPQQNTITDTTFLVAAGSPIPTPLAIDVTQQTILTYVLNITNILVASKPTPSLLVAGTVSAASGPFGNFSGAPAAISMGYTTDTPPKINNVVEVIAGQALAYSASGTVSSLTFPAAPVTPPTTANSAPTVVLSPVPPATGSIQVFASAIQLNASGSSDPQGLPLTFLWTSDKPVNWQPSPNVANPTVTFGSGAGDYTITVTVTNSAGLSSTGKIVLTYINK